MPKKKGNYCNVEGCHNRSEVDGDTVRHYYRLPGVITHQGKKTEELSSERRRLWLAKIDQDFEGKNLSNVRVCSDHFINNESAKLYDKDSPSWLPTVNMSSAERQKGSVETAVKANDRYTRKVSRHKKVEAAAAMVEFNHSFFDEDPAPEPVHMDEEVDEEPESGTGTQTEVDANLYVAMTADLQRLRTENIDLKQEVLRLSNHHTMDEYKRDDTKVKFNTGLPTFSLLLALFNFVQVKLPMKQCLNKFQLLMLCLMKIRLNRPIQALAYEFAISKASASRYFNETIDVLYVCLKHMIYWPDRDQLRKTMPMQFRKHFGKKIAVIIDCFEIMVERPSNAEARVQLWSSYKHHHTIKYLIGVIPQGMIGYLSKAWCGRTSDKYITEHSGFLEKLMPGDVVMADRGFRISDSLGTVGAELEIPAFVRGREHLSPLDIASTRKLANVRIHVERIIGVGRQKYTVLNGVLSVEMLHGNYGEKCVQIDKIVHVAAALVNMCPSVVSID